MTDQLGVDLSDLIVQPEVIANPEVQVHVVPFSVSPADPVLQALAGLPEVHQVFPQHAGVPGSAVSPPPGRRVAPILVAYLLFSDPAPAESLSRFQAQGQVEGLPDVILRLMPSQFPF